MQNGDSKASLNSTDTEEKLRSAFQSFVSQRKFTLFLRVLFVCVVGLISMILIEQLFYLSAIQKISSATLLLLIVAFIIGRSIKAQSILSFTEFYRTFSRNSDIPELKDVLDLERSGKGNRALIDAAILQNLKQIDTARLDSKLTEHRQQSHIYKQYKNSFILTIMAVLVAIFTISNLNEAFSRTITFWQNYEMPNPFHFTIQPGDVTLEQGSTFQAELTFHGSSVPKNISLQVKTAVENDFRAIGINELNGNYQSIAFDLNTDLEYFIQMDGFKSERYNAKVQLRPRFKELQAKIIPPSYTGLDSTEFTYPFSQIRAYEGSEIILSGLLNKDLDSLSLASTNSLIPLTVESDSSFNISIDLTQNDTLHFSMADKNGLTNKNPFQLILAPRKDEYPVVEILEPAQSIEKVNPKQLDILYRASDDFQLTSARFHYELKRAFVSESIKGNIKLEKPANGAIQPFMWALDSLNLKPQDILYFWVEVQDNDGYSGYKTSSSSVLSLTIPSLVNYFEDLDEKEDEVGSGLDDVSESFRQMQEQYERFKEKMKENPDNVGYEQAQELEQVKRQQEEVQKQIEELNRKFEEIKQEINESNVLSEETQQAYEELQKLMQDIDDPDFLDALQKMREQLGQLSPEQLREAMENLEFNEEVYRQRLERTLELFKQLKLNSDLEKLVKSYEDLARQEDEFQNNSELTEDERAAQREQTLKENEKLKQKVDSLSKNTSERNQKSIQDYQEDAKQKLDELSQQIQDEIENGSAGDNSDSDQQNQDIEQSYQQLAEQTRSLMQGMSQQQAQFNIAALRYTLQSLLTLSGEQEDLSMLTSATENRSQAFVGFARNQQNVEAIFSTLSDSLFQLSTESPQFSNTINEKKLEVQKQLDRALTFMAERSNSQSSIATRQALGGINEIAFMLANLLEQLQNSQNNGGGGGGSMQQMIEQMQQSGEQQQQLNQQIQEMINDIQGERLSQDQMERLNEIAKAQNRIRKQLQEIRQNGQAGDKIGSELERMIEQMEETINDLRGGSTDPTMIRRQQNILSRMLEAEKALQERDEEENKREGRSAEDFIRSAPPELSLEELEKQIKKRLNDPDFTKYSDDYQRLIEKYFELLQEIQ